MTSFTPALYQLPQHHASQSQLCTTHPSTMPADPSTLPLTPSTMPADPSTTPFNPSSVPLTPSTIPSDPNTLPLTFQHHAFLFQHCMTHPQHHEETLSSLSPSPDRLYSDPSPLKYWIVFSLVGKKLTCKFLSLPVICKWCFLSDWELLLLFFYFPDGIILCECVCARTHVLLGAHVIYVISWIRCLPFEMRVSWWTWNLPVQLDAPVSASHYWDNRCVQPCMTFFLCAGEPHSDHHDCEASPLKTEMCPWRFLMSAFEA